MTDTYPLRYATNNLPIVIRLPVIFMESLYSVSTYDLTLHLFFRLTTVRKMWEMERILPWKSELVLVELRCGSG
jgi:hypothetical protein